MSNRLTLDAETWRKVRMARGHATDSAAARDLGIDPSHISRAAAGHPIGATLLSALFLHWREDVDALVKPERAA